MATSDAAFEVLSPEDVLGIGLGSDILIVDDDESTRSAYDAALAPLGRRAVLASSGTEALAKLLAQDFALVLLDISMPDMNGIETARLIRQRPRNRGTPIIFITGAPATSELVLEAYEVGAYDFVAKPILPEILRAKARVYLHLQERTALLQKLAQQYCDARRAAEALNARKDELLAMLGHELRNPLAAIVSAVDIIKLRDPAHGREVMILDRQVAHLAHIVGELVDVARITQGKIALRREAVAVADAVREAIESARPAIDAHHVKVAVPMDALVDADRHRLAQVLGNLLLNAAKYTPGKGRIDIDATIHDEVVRIVVRDNGRGIAPALLPSLFDLFVQGERTPDRHEGGLGIGLTLVRTLVELHGGTVEAHSDGPGTGATFTVRWPKASSQTATAKTPALTRPVPGAPLRILIVDDNADAAEMLSAVVGSLGHETALAHDGMTGLEIAQDFAPHVALLDIGLPVIDGYELAARLRALPACSRTILVAVTGYGQSEDRERSKRAGFAHHLVKPIELATLRTLLVTDEE
jgi:signal transduction histidine kinase